MSFVPIGESLIDPTIPFLVPRSSFSSRDLVYQPPAGIKSLDQDHFESDIRYMQNSKIDWNEDDIGLAKYNDLDLLRELKDLRTELWTYIDKNPDLSGPMNDLRKMSNTYENIGSNLIISADKRGKIDKLPFRWDGYKVSPPFITRAAIKLANIDAIFGLTGPVGLLSTLQYRLERRVGMENYQEVSSELNKSFDSNNLPLRETFTFCDIAGGPGGFTQYLQYRRPDSLGFGISLRNKSKSFNWYKDALDMSKFNIIYGESNTGNIFSEYNYFIQEVLNNTLKEGVDLAVGDGCVDLPRHGSEEEFRNSSLLNFYLFLYQTYISIRCCKVGGILCLKLFGTNNTEIIQILYLISMAYEEFYLFKPISSRINSREVYVIAKKKHPDVSGVISVLEKAMNVFGGTGEIQEDTNIILNIVDEDSISTTFSNYVRDFNISFNEQNMEVIKRNLDFFNKYFSVDHMENADFYLKYIMMDPENDPHKINPDKALLLWNLPST